MLLRMTDDAATAALREIMPLLDTLGVRAERYTPEAVVLALDHAPRLCTAAGLLHGGVIMALADSAGAACAYRNLPDGASGTSTIESKTNFLGAVRSGTVTATARPLHTGRTTVVVETDVHDAGGKFVARVTQTQLVAAG